MIFYFSGTGNSEYVAKMLLKEDERLISMAKATKNKEYSYDGNGESLGFVFPTYFYNVPTFVESFIEKLEASNVSYVYAIITCGGSIKQAGNKLKAMLEKRGLELSYVTELKMPDNSMLFYQIPEVSKAKDRIAKSSLIIEDIKKDIEANKSVKISDFTLISDVLKLAYDKCQKTAKFWVDKAKCTRCGLCTNNCPEEAIVMSDGTPTWVKDECCKCSACINRCPNTAINYGKATLKRNRYVFPNNID